MIYVCITYSSGLPILYPVAFIALFITYWTDKILLLRYFRVHNQFTAENSKTVVLILPYAAVLHFLWGYFVYSYPQLLKSGTESSALVDSAGSYYMDQSRIGQMHMVWFTICFLVVIGMLVLETPIIWLLSKFVKCLSFVIRRIWFGIRCKPFEPAVDENDEVIDAPDYYFEINFSHLCKEYKL